MARRNCWIVARLEEEKWVWAEFVLREDVEGRVLADHSDNWLRDFIKHLNNGKVDRKAVEK